MAYDPTHSLDFAALVRENPEATETADESYWLPILNAAAMLMDDDIREALHDEMAPCKALDFLVAYMERHYAAYGEHFRWG